MKQCKKCLKWKDKSEFGENKKMKDGYLKLCKECERKRKKDYKKTKKGIVVSIFDGQKRSSKTRGHNSPSYTRKELQEWLFNQDLFHELYDLWVSSGYDKYQKPSIDRLDNSKGYSFDNIRLVTWKENLEKSYKDKREANLKPKSLFGGGHKAVLQFDLDGNFIAEYISLHEAERQTGIKYQNIVTVCRKKIKTAGGFMWKYKDVKNNEE